MTSQAVVFGPGEALGRELVAGLTDRGQDVTIVSRSRPSWLDESLRHIACDLRDVGDTVGVCKQLAAEQVAETIIYGARPQRANHTDPDAIQRFERICAGAAWDVYRTLGSTLVQNSGHLVLIGGDFGVNPHPDYPALSAGKKRLHQIGTSWMKRSSQQSPQVRLVIPYGRIDDCNRQQVVQEILTGIKPIARVYRSRSRVSPG